MTALIIKNKKTWRWVNNNVLYADYQLLADGIIVDGRCIEDVFYGLKENGFRNKRDFECVKV